MTEKLIRNSMINAMRQYIGAVYGDAKQHEIVDTYNRLCRTQENHNRWGTRMLTAVYSYGWCAETTSAAASSARYKDNGGNIRTLDDVIPVEMGVDELYNIAIRNHIWQAKGNGYTPQIADLIVFKWATGNPSKPIQWHIGLIEEVHDGYWTTIEGNVGEPRQCGRKTRMFNDATYIGVISPLYCTIATEDDDDYNTEPDFVGRCVEATYVRTEPSGSAPVLKQWQKLGIGNLVDVCDEVDGYYYVRIAGLYFGFVPMRTIVDNDAKQVKEKAKTAIVKTRTYMRQTPSALGKIMTLDFGGNIGKRMTVKDGWEVKIASINGEWAKLELVKGNGEKVYPYVKTKYLIII